MKRIIFLSVVAFAMSLVAEGLRAAEAPRGFVVQKLEPTGGKVNKPKAWFYTESHDGPSLTWILSKEDASKGRYETGMRIQLIFEIKKHTGKSARQFILEFLKKKRKEAGKILSECKPHEDEFFTRVCLETEEKNDHILYSLYYSGDIAGVVIIGTTKDQWSKYEGAFSQMKHVQLIDMEYLERKAAGQERADAKKKKMNPKARKP